MFKQINIKVADIFQSQLTNILEQVSEELNSFPQFPDTSKMVALYPDENFLLHEISNYTQLFHLITKQVEVLKTHLAQQVWNFLFNPNVKYECTHTHTHTLILQKSLHVIQ